MQTTNDRAETPASADAEIGSQHAPDSAMNAIVQDEYGSADVLRSVVGPLAQRDDKFSLQARQLS